MEGASTEWNGPREAVSRCGSAASKKIGVPCMMRKFVDVPT